MEFSPVPTRAATRAVLKAQKAGQTTVDISKTPAPGGGDGGNTGGGGKPGGDGGIEDDPLG